MTGQASSPRRHASGGFTLIEVLVVITLLSVILAMVGLSLTTNPSDGVRDEARRLAMLLQTLREETILQGSVMAVALESEGYEFYQLNEKGQLAPVEHDDSLRPHRLPQGMTLIHDIDSTDNLGRTMILLFPTGEQTPFSATFAQGEARWVVSGDMDGLIRTGTPDQLEAG